MSNSVNENVRKYFEDVVGRIKKALNTDKDSVVAEALNIQPTAFYNRRKNGSLPLKNIVAWAAKKQISIDWLVTGEGFMVLTDAEIELAKKNKKDSDKSNITQITIEHQDLIKRFKDPDKAKEFNKYLINIEENDPDGYEELFQKAKTIHQTINRLKPKNKAPQKTKQLKRKQANGD